MAPADLGEGATAEGPAATAHDARGLMAAAADARTLAPTRANVAHLLINNAQLSRLAAVERALQGESFVIER